MNSEEILKGLNPAQQDAVMHTEGALLVLAGAGSGKTRVLTQRIAYLVGEKNVNPWNILAITFTNKAASEIKGRLYDAVGPAAGRIWAGTFHSVCLRILRREINALGYDSNFSIYDTGDQQSLIKAIVKEKDYDDKKFTPRSCLNRISAWKNELITPDEAGRAADNWFEEYTAVIYSLYQKRLKENNALDFDDLILLAIRLFRNHPDILEKYRDQFRYVLVDEYQDTNNAQYELVRFFASKHRNIMVVGDDDQSIYGWRGANIENILNFEHDYPNTKVVRLEQNYRSTQNILEAANSVIANNTMRKGKNLWSAGNLGEKINCFTAQDEAEEAYYIVRTISDMKYRENRNNRDFAVLCRITAQFRAIEEAMMRTGISYRVFGGQKFYERKEIKDLLSYLRLVANSSDEVSLQRIINVPKRGFGATSWNKIYGYARTNGMSIFSALGIAGRDVLSGKAAAAAKDFHKLVSEFKELEKTVTVTELTEKILEMSGYFQMLRAEKTVESATRLENLEEFLTVTQDFDRKTENKGRLSDFLLENALLTDTDSYDEGDDNVVLMTVHSAKGLEFPVVFMTGMEENIFPHARSIHSAEGSSEAELEEERRLCYVALTRAKEKVFLTRTFSRYLYGRPNYNKASRFLEEIPENLLSGHQVKKQEDSFSRSPAGQAAAGLFSSPAAGKEKRTAEVSSDYRAGDRVEHGKWGQGVVVSVKGEGEDMSLKVAFPMAGVKDLIVRYAPIKKI